MPSDHRPTEDANAWIPPDLRAKRHADLQTADAWRCSRRRRRIEIAAAILLLAVTPAACSVEGAIGPDSAKEIRAAVAESVAMMLPE